MIKIYCSMCGSELEITSNQGVTPDGKGGFDLEYEVKPCSNCLEKLSRTIPISDNVHKIMEENRRRLEWVLFGGEESDE